MRFLLIVCLFIFQSALAQTDRDSYRQYVVNHPALGRIDYHVGTVNALEDIR